MFLSPKVAHTKSVDSTKGGIITRSRAPSPWGALNGVTPSHNDAGTGTIEALLAEANNALGENEDGKDSVPVGLLRPPTEEATSQGTSDHDDHDPEGKSKDLVLQQLAEVKKAIAADQVKVLGVISDCMESVRMSMVAEAQALKKENRRLQAELIKAGAESRRASTDSGPSRSRRSSSEGPPRGSPANSQHLPLPLPSPRSRRQSEDCSGLPVSITAEDMPGVLCIPPSSPMELPTSSEGVRSQTDRQPRRSIRDTRRDSLYNGGRNRRPSLLSMGSQALFADADKMKQQIRQSIAKPVYNVTHFYKESGFWQKLARSQWFEQLTLVVIGLNAIWIGIDTDYNDSQLLMGAHPIFIVMENVFCLFFTIEWFARFMAFKKTAHAFRDAWFMFDSVLVAITIAETWLLTLAAGLASAANGGQSAEAIFNTDASLFRIFRLLRISKMARMARIFRAIPELMIVMKALVAGIRSVAVTLGMLTLIIYIFGLAFTSLAAGTALGEQYFSGVAHSMGTLLLHGVFLEDIPDVFSSCGRASFVYSAFLLAFVLIATFLVVNMLVGVMVETVHVVSMVEREQLSVTFTKDKLLHMLHATNLDADGDEVISKAELATLLQIPAAVKALQELGVDAVALVDLTSYVFEESPELTFPNFMDLVLQLRGSNKATVKDIVDLRKCMRQEIYKLSKMVEFALPQRSTSNLAGAPSGELSCALSGGYDGPFLASLKSKEWGSFEF